MVAIPDEPARIATGDEWIDEALAASGIKVPAEDATAIRNLALFFLTQAEIVSGSLLVDAETASGTGVGLPEQRR